MNGFRLHDPLWLLMLVPVVAGAVFAIRRQRRDAVLYSSVELVRGLPLTLMLRIKRLLPWVRVAGLALLVVALARPQRGLREFRVTTEGIAIQMCLDRSGSMQAMDFEIDGKRVKRLEAVKKVFREFVLGGGGLRGRPDDLIGLITFGGFAEGRAPLTLDHGAVVEILKAVEIPKPVEDAQGRVINERFLQEELATAIGDAVALAVERLKDSPAKSKIVILLSDGESNAGVVSPEAAAQAAKSYGIKVYTIGIGSTGPAPFPIPDGFGGEVLRTQMVRLDEPTLMMVAETTGGQYANAKDTRTLEQIYARLDELEKTETEGRLYTEYVELYLWFLLPGLGLVVLETVLTNTRFRALP